MGERRGGGQAHKNPINDQSKSKASCSFDRRQEVFGTNRKLGLAVVTNFVVVAFALFKQIQRL